MALNGHLSRTRLSLQVAYLTINQEQVTQLMERTFKRDTPKTGISCFFWMPALLGESIDDPSIAAFLARQG
eukprot:2875863-Amphidinium_carterae.1